MQELRILEVCIALFITLPLIRRFVKAFHDLDGLALFPAFGLISSGALFLVYGFRPECVPLLIVAGIITVHSIPGIIGLAKRERQETFLSSNPMYTAVFLCGTAVSVGLGVLFAPVIDTTLRTEGVRTVAVTHEARKAEFFLRIYDSVEGAPNRRPVLFLVPPVIGSVASADAVCGALEAQGFTVITYSRRNFDVPAVGATGKRYGVSFGTLMRFVHAFTLGRAFEGANTAGRALEGERTEDMLFLLGYIRDRLELGPTADRSAVFLGGYDIGGSGALFIGESPELLKENPQLKGLIAIESPFWSVYQPEERRPLAPPEGSVQWFRNLWSGITGWFSGITPKRMTGMKQVPRLELPTLFLVSDRAVLPRYRDGRYRPIVRLLQSSPAALAAVNGAGVLGYSDYPAKYPLYGAFFSGSRARAWGNREYIEGTAALIAAFARLTLTPAEPKNPLTFSEHQRRLLGKIHFESGGVWNLPSLRSILIQ